MFWSSPASQSTIDELLDQEDLTIQKLLDDDNILQKCHEKDPRLTEFLCRVENVEYLVNQITTPPIFNDFDSDLYRHPSLACEIMTCDIGLLSDKLVQAERTLASDQNSPCTLSIRGDMAVDSSAVCASSNESLSNSDMSTSSVANVSALSDSRNLDASFCSTQSRPLLDRFFNTLRAPLNPLSASFLCRILVHLSIHRGQIVIPYMRAFPNLLGFMLSHFDLSVLPDVLIQLAQQERGFQKFIFEWFREDNLVSRLIELFSPTNPSEVHESAAHCLVQLIITLRNYIHNNAPPNREANATFDTGLPPASPYAMLLEDDGTYNAAVRLLDVLESEDSLNAILNHLANEATVTTSIAINCIDVLTTVMDKRKPETGFPPSERGPGMDLDQILGHIGNPSQPHPGRDSHTNVSGDTPHEGDQSDSTEQVRVAQACSNLAKACLPRLHHLHVLLQRPHPQACNRMCTTFGTLDPPLGTLRFMLAQFLTLLVSLPPETGLAQGLIKEGIVKTLMDLFEHYPFNTLLHQAVTELVLTLFYHARVISSKHSGKKERQQESPSEQPSQTSSEAKSTNSTSDDNRMDVDVQATDESRCMDHAFVTIVKDYGITDWCLRLSRASIDPSSNPAFNPADKQTPKPGYTGHLWRLANSIEDARIGPRRDFVLKVFRTLSPTSLSAWDEFVSNHLAKINAQQVADDVVIENAEQKNCALRMLLQQNVSSWLSQSSSLLSLSSTVGGSGKLSLLLGPLSFGATSGSTACNATSGDQLDLSVRTQFDANAVDVDDPYLEPNETSSNLWMHTDDACGPRQGSSLSVIGLGDSQNLMDLNPDGFRCARIASVSSDESEPDEDPHARLGCHDSDADDEEEDLHSPMIIKQQRSGDSLTQPIIASTTPISPWDYGQSAAAMADTSTDNLYAWANFDDDPSKVLVDPGQSDDRGSRDNSPLASSPNGLSEKDHSSAAQKAPTAVDVSVSFASDGQHSPSRKSMA
ncbi:unnamed protein product [Dicrocoelium dendriticum]|nr:unnamed protein product [Dicrocoelium dendriticum]